MNAGALLDGDDLFILGGCVGAQVLLLCLSVIIANAYRERALLVHAAAILMGVLSLYALLGPAAVSWPVTPGAGALMAVLGLAGLQLRELVGHAGALRGPRRWLVGISLVLLALAVLSAALHWNLLLPASAVFAAVLFVVMLRAWPQSQPWVLWLLPGLLALLAGAAWLGLQAPDEPAASLLPLAGLLTFWAAATYLSTVWRSRIMGETRVRMNARTTVDPLTGLATPLVLQERIEAARALIKRYGHPSVLLLVHIEGLARLSGEYGPEVAESAVLVSAERVRLALGDGGVAARLTHSRMAVLAEGISLAEGASNMASRILVAGLKAPLPAAPAEFLQFRIVLTAVPTSGPAAKGILHRLGDLMDAQLAQPGERRIVTITAEELLA